MSNKSETIMAIDFGTSNSLVGAYHQGNSIVGIPLDSLSDDSTMMRSLLYFPNPDLCYYGQNAIQKYLDNEMEGRLFRSFKAHLPNQNYLGTMVLNRVVSLENMIGYFLLELKKRTEKELNTEITKAVIGKPARYSMDPVADQFALYRMKKAAELAGFQEVRYVPEPLAAAFDYRKNNNQEKVILIGDFGGGTSDFTIMKIHPGDYQESDVLAIDGCPLAGDAFDRLLMKNKLNVHFGATARYRFPMSSNVLTMPPGISERLENPAHIVFLKDRETYEFIKEVKKYGLTDDDKESIERLQIMIDDQQIFSFFEVIESTKKKLSNENSVDFHFDYPDLEVDETFQRLQFENWAQDNSHQIFAAVERCFNQAQLTEKDIDLVCLTGGTSKVPLIANEFIRRFGVEKLQTQSQFHSVISGLTEAAKMWGKEK